MLKKICWISFVLIICVAYIDDSIAADLRAGTAVVDITDREAGPCNDPLFAKALVLSSGETNLVIVTIDAVAIGGIGRIGDDFMPTVRQRLKSELGIAPENLIVNASHCHGVIRSDVAQLTMDAIKQAAASQQPVVVGVGAGAESEIQVNRRLRLSNGKEADIRHAYSMPPNDEVVELGPVDPEIGLLRFDRLDGEVFAVVYNFACHPIQGVPSGGNTADLVGFASKAIEESLGDGCTAFFLQGCAGDINPINYKQTHVNRDAEPLGNRLGLSVLRAIQKIVPKPDSRLVIRNTKLPLPRADTAQQISDLEADQLRLAQSLRGTSLSFDTFVPLLVKYSLGGEYPSNYRHLYLREKQASQHGLANLDRENRSNLAQYINNVRIMEELTRVNTNLALLRKHQAENLSAKSRFIDVDLTTIRIADCLITTFPGELTAQIGLDIKAQSAAEFTFVAGYTNGYIFYAPTTQQLRNVGGAQEDSDCILAPLWEEQYKSTVLEVLSEL
ncbi:MAG: hypothetical protein R3C09_17005 [Pirellulaceae bacterium]